jgi:predicted ATPase
MHIKAITLHPEKYPDNSVYPFNLDLFQATTSLSLDSPVSFFAGENGTGKSTLLKAAARRCGIHIWEGNELDRTKFRRNRYESRLHEYLDVTWASGPVPGSFFAAEIFRNFAILLDEWAVTDPAQLKYFGGDSLMTKSHGQSHMAFFQNRFRIRGLYFLDEPENALSPARQMEFVQLLQDAAANNEAQFIIATHSPILLSCPGASIFSFDETPVRTVAYRETGHYRLYDDFFKKMRE